MKIEDFVKQYGVECNAKKVSASEIVRFSKAMKSVVSERGDSSSYYIVTLTHNLGSEVTYPFFQGDHRDEAPAAARVIRALLTDSAVRDCDDYMDFANQLGYELDYQGDNHDVKNVYATVMNQTDRFEKWLPEGVTIDMLAQ